MTHGSEAGWRRILTWLKGPIGVGLIAFLIHKNWDDFANFLRQPIDWRFLALGCGISIFSVVLTFLRWYLLVWAQQFQFSVRDAVRLGFMGCLLNYVGPGALGGDFIKGAMLVRRQSERRLIAASTVILDRVLGLVALLLVGTVATFFAPDNIVDRDIITTFVWTGSILGVGGLVLLLHPAMSRSRLIVWAAGLPKVGPFIADIANSAALYQSRRRVIVLGVLMGIVGQFGTISAFYLCARAVAPAEDVMSFSTHILWIPMAELISMIPLTPGGAGTLEAAVQYGYGLAGKNQALGLAAALGYRLLSIVVALIGGVYWAIGHRDITQAIADAEDPKLASNPLPGDA